MRNFGFIIFVFALIFRVGIIFFDRVKSADDKGIMIIYEDSMYGSNTIQTNILDVEKNLITVDENNEDNILTNTNSYKINIPDNQNNISKENERKFLLEYIKYKKEHENDFRENINSDLSTRIKNRYPINFPKQYDLKNITFYSQAPYGDWNEPYQNACEEASILLAYYYIINKHPSKLEYKTDLLNLMSWEQNNLGHHKDTTIDEFLYLIKIFLKLGNSFIINNPTVNQIKSEISKGNIIIAPFRGKELHNPHYSLGGPYYHVMVIKGYNENNFITYDVGTSKGKDRQYSIDTIMLALANGNKKILDKPGTKIIVLEKKDK